MTYVIMGTGSDRPAWVVTNDEIEAVSRGYYRACSGRSLHEWVMERGGASSATRHRLSAGEGTTDMAVRAAERAMADAGVTVADVDLVVLGTFTSDCRLPSTVSSVAQTLGVTGKCIQLETSCTGFLDSLLVATSLMGAAQYRTALVISVEAMSAVVDHETFMYQTIFGDGAGAVILQDLPGKAYRDRGFADLHRRDELRLDLDSRRRHEAPDHRAGARRPQPVHQARVPRESTTSRSRRWWRSPTRSSTGSVRGSPTWIG